ncbi:uncharacterized protein LOC119353046 [Triticum dicoccoides]|uniref:uncharacterized protein LOC119353046 n=1 Tax=Triticum dicoccoides TaxID=85692 RepID=UPI0018903C21|nr:uncharacterized protein LOC119353046 [Triticum dicoccoides]
MRELCRGSCCRQRARAIARKFPTFLPKQIVCSVWRASLNYKVKATFFEVLCTSPSKKVQHPLPGICKREASERAQQDGSSPLRSMATKTGATVVAMEERNRWRRGGQGGRFGGYD